MKAIIIKCAPHPGCNPIEVPGWLVPDTEDLLGVDMRYEADLEAIPPQAAGWVITHLPTGMRIAYLDYTRAGCSFDACGLAKRFYDEYKARGWTIASDQPELVTAPFKTLSYAEKIDFWEKVAAWPKKDELVEQSPLEDYIGALGNTSMASQERK